VRNVTVVQTCALPISGKIAWVIIGLFVLGIALSNIYAVLGLVAAYALYAIFKNWKKDGNHPVVQVVEDNDPFTNFERQWAELNRSEERRVGKESSWE